MLRNIIPTKPKQRKTPVYTGEIELQLLNHFHSAGTAEKITFFFFSVDTGYKGAGNRAREEFKSKNHLYR